MAGEAAVAARELGIEQVRLRAPVHLLYDLYKALPGEPVVALFGSPNKKYLPFVRALAATSAHFIEVVDTPKPGGVPRLQVACGSDEPLLLVQDTEIAEGSEWWLDNERILVQFVRRVGKELLVTVVRGMFSEATPHRLGTIWREHRWDAEDPV